MVIAAADGSGNRSTPTYEVDQASASKTLTYDANGNLTADGVRTLEWDARNQLLAVSQGTHRSELTYDGWRRRVRIVEKDAGVVATDQRFVWCGSQVCEERDASGATVTKRFFSQGVQDTGISYFYTSDHLGSVRELTDPTGALRARYDYDPWGRRTKLVGDLKADIGFTRHYQHGPSGLTLAPYRAYDSNLGRWVSEDVSGMTDRHNLYAYAGGNSVSRLDLFGLDCVYSQSTGQLTHVDSAGNTTNAGSGYSGHGDGLRNPAMQNVHDVGPIPQGTWTIGQQQNHGTGNHMLPASMRLTPANDTDTFGRSGLLIHGDNNSQDQSASTGCIVLNLNIRNRIGGSGDHILRVVP
jgi:RHS repeat-associated protein